MHRLITKCLVVVFIQPQAAYKLSEGLQFGRGSRDPLFHQRNPAVTVYTSLLQEQAVS